MSPRALPLLVVAVLTSSGAWHVATPAASGWTSASANGLVRAVGQGQVAERSIAGRGQVSRDVVPASAPAGEGAAPEERRTQEPLPGGGGPRAPPLA